jgi:hypothetical protein
MGRYYYIMIRSYGCGGWMPDEQNYDTGSIHLRKSVNNNNNKKKRRSNILPII